MRGELAQFHATGAAALHYHGGIPKHVYHGEAQAGTRHRIDRLHDSPTRLNVLIDRCYESVGKIRIRTPSNPPDDRGV
jgi:hypothetical protein